MRIPHNKGKSKYPFGPHLTRVRFSCQACGRGFLSLAKNYYRGGARFCSRSCNPAYQPKFTPYVKNRRSNLKRNYGITQDVFDAMSAAQGGLCAICCEPPGGKWKILYVDHCHLTKKIRGLLCISCNRALGWFRDNPTYMRSAADYVERAA